MNVYLLGCNDRATLSVVRSLYNINQNIYIISNDAICISNRSKCIKDKYILGDSENIDILKKEISNLMQTDSFVIPMNDYFTVFIEHYFNELNEKYILPYESKKSLSTALNKHRIILNSKKLGIFFPKTLLVSSEDEFYKIDKNNLKFPLILKPIRSCIVIGNRIIRTSVKKIKSYAELELQVRLSINNVSLLIQEYIEGHGRAVNYFSIKGEIVNYFQYERLHEPSFGGGSSLRKSMDVEIDVKDCSQRLIKSIEYSGIGMIEYRYSPKLKKYYLMEINARFWGSLSLPIFSGMNFPLILYKYFIYGEINDHSYKNNVYARHLLKDIKWVTIRLKKRNFRLVYQELKLLFYNQIKRNEVFDVERFMDIKPMFCQYVNILITLKTRIMNIIIDKVLLFKNIIIKTKTKTKALMLIKENNLSINFVCKGNIIRSAFAEKYFNMTNLSTADSCGLYPQSNRLAPINAISAAKKMDVNLSDHKSKYIADYEDSNNNILYFVMDDRQYSVMKYKYRMRHVYMLGVFLQNTNNIIIKDPYHDVFNDNSYLSSFGKIKESIDNLNILMTQ